jgi:hypothetical protein
LTGAVERTWAPAGQTPVLHVVKGSQSKLSVAALCCYRPGHEPRMLYRTRPGWYHDRDLIALLDQAHQELAAPILLVWDNLSGHRSGRMRRAIAARAWLEVEYLPAYAPELNPAEGAWAHLRATALANLAALSFVELAAAVRGGLRRIQRRPDLVAAFLAHTGLQLRTQ